LGLTLKSSIDQLDRHGFLFGKKLAASMSPLLHSVVYRGLGLNWGQIRLDSTDMDLFLRLIRHPKFYGTPRSCLGKGMAWFYWLFWQANLQTQGLPSPCRTKSPSSPIWTS
jgi:hypothetical protein